MPTSRRRHAITETPQVEEVLDELRAELGLDRLPMGEIVVLGARAKLAALRGDAEQRSERRRRLGDRIRARRAPSIDREAAEEVRRAGWARPS